MFLVFVVACFVLVLVLFRFLFPALVLIAVLVSVIKLTGWWPTLRKMGPSAGDAIVQVFVFLLVFVLLMVLVVLVLVLVSLLSRQLFAVTLPVDARQAPNLL